MSLPPKPLKPIHILSLGAGVQSSTVALMASIGLITPMPEAAIFADTQSEPQDVYDYLYYLTPLLQFPFYIVTQGNLGQEVLNAVDGKINRASQPPFYVKSKTENSGGMLWRQCTKDFKLVPIARKVQELRRSGGNTRKVIQWIGISLDEAHRMKESRVKYSTNRYPLIELRMSRWDCLLWLKRNNYKEPPKSACYFCPYISNNRWQSIKTKQPDTFEKAAVFDESIRNMSNSNPSGQAAGIKGEIFIHRSMTPLRTANLKEDNTPDMFGNECEGMCGV